MKKRIYLLALVPLLALPGPARAQQIQLAPNGAPTSTSFFEGDSLNATWVFYNSFNSDMFFAWLPSTPAFGGEAGDQPAAPVNGQVTIGGKVIAGNTWVKLPALGTVTYTFSVGSGGNNEKGDNEPPAEKIDSGTMTVNALMYGNNQASWQNYTGPYGPFSLTFTEIDLPEPFTLALAGMGAVGLLARAWRQRMAKI